mmetsp:Transcript_3046/g.8228  ORF Transcript_3046/g.8228 Transcript_3046/m.8228 type:complete len:303 (-) Transcript_3046:241-1149(-)
MRACSVLLLLLPLPDGRLWRRPGLEQPCERGRGGAKPLRALQLLVQVRQARCRHAVAEVLRLEGIFDARPGLSADAILVHDDMYRHSEVRRCAPAKPHGDGLAAPVEAAGVEVQERPEERARSRARSPGSPGRRRGCPAHAKPGRHLEAGQRRQERGARGLLPRARGLLPGRPHLEEVEREERPGVGRQVALGSVAEAAVLRPAPDQQLELQRSRRHRGTRGEQGGVAEGSLGVHQEVDGNALLWRASRRRRDERDLGLLTPEGRAPELEGPRAHKLLGARSDGGLLEFPRVEPLRGAVGAG